MPADRIDAAVRRLSPEPLVCWCNGQSLESRYSQSATSAGAPGGALGAGILRHQLGRARRVDAVPMPRFPVVAVSARRIYLFSGPVPDTQAFAVLPRDQVQVASSGNAMWRRLDILAADEGRPRSYTMMVSGLSGGRKRLQRLIDELLPR